MNTEINNNQVFLSGEIAAEPIYSHQVFGEGFYETQLSIARLSEQADIIPITISDRLISEQEITKGSKISVVGQFRSYNKIVDGKSKLMLTVFVREVVSETYINSNNQIELTGFVCKEPVFRTTPFKREIADVIIAINRAYNKSDYIPCIAWGRNAKFVSTLEIGVKINVIGRIQSRKYSKTLENGTVEERTAYEISINRVSVVE